MRATGNSFAAALEAFCTQASLPPSYFLGDATNMVLLAQRIGDTALPFEDLHTFCTSPTDTGSPGQLAALALFARRYAEAGTLNPETVDDVVTHAVTSLERVPASDVELKRVEELWHVYSLYVWLGARFGPGVFEGLAEAQQKRDRCTELIELGLSRAAAAGPKPVQMLAGAAGEGLSMAQQQQQQQGRQRRQQQQWQGVHEQQAEQGRERRQQSMAEQQRQRQQQQQQQQQRQLQQQQQLQRKARAEKRLAKRMRARQRWSLEEEACVWEDGREAAHAW